MNTWLAHLTAIVLILIPIFLAIGLRRKAKAPWMFFFVGGVVFVVSKLIRLALEALLRRFEVLPDAPIENIDILVAALVTGVVIEIARIIIIVIFRRSRTPSNVMMVGLGSGSFIIIVLAMLLTSGDSSSSTGVISDFSVNTSINPSVQIGGFIIHYSSGINFVISSLVIAVLMLVVETNTSYMVLRAFDPKNSWLFLGAMFYHSLINGIVFFGLIRLENIWLTSFILVLISVPLSVFCLRLTYGNNKAEPKQEGPPRSEIQLLVASIQKEMLYQWRTRRILIIIAIFMVFGMASPLIAKFTPSLLGLVEGGEQLVDLIPEPTATDAVGQYIKNLTQFGFILAIVVGMGAVAGEKERNTAGMVLSKPMPRWVFLISKFVAQAIVYTIGFVLAMMAAYYYTVFLFGTIGFLDFIGLNGLLLIWLIVFVAVTLFGSTIGRSTASAAGIALLLCVILLVAGTLPRYGSYAPGGLISWASTLFIEGDVVVNGGSLTTSLSLILLALLGSLAVFEEQEV